MPTGIWISRLKSGSAHWDLKLAVEVLQCPLRPGSRGWGPAVPTAICNSRLRSGSAHWDLELAVEGAEAGEEAEEAEVEEEAEAEEEEENSADKI